jgi:hypothetical protein
MRPIWLIGKSPRTPWPPWKFFEKGAMDHLGRIQQGPMGCYRPIRGSPDGAHGPPHCPTSPTQLLRVSALALCDPSQGAHAAHRAHRKEPEDTMATMDLI